MTDYTDKNNRQRAADVVAALRGKDAADFKDGGANESMMQRRLDAFAGTFKPMIPRLADKETLTENQKAQCYRYGMRRYERELTDAYHLAAAERAARNSYEKEVDDDPEDAPEDVPEDAAEPEPTFEDFIASLGDDSIHASLTAANIVTLDALLAIKDYTTITGIGAVKAQAINDALSAIGAA